MDMMFMEQHFLRSPLRLYSELDVENNNQGNFFSAAMMEKARAQLQLWGRGGGELPVLPGYGARVPLPAHLWAGAGQNPWTAGLLGPPLPPRPTQITPPPTSTPSSSGSPSPSELRLPRPVFPQHRYSPYLIPKQTQESVPARN